MSIGGIGGIGSGNIPPSGGGPTPPGGPDESGGPKKVENKKQVRTDTADVYVPQNALQQYEWIDHMGMLYGPQDLKRFDNIPESSFTSLMAHPELSTDQQSRVRTLHERWKARQKTRSVYPLPVQPVEPVAPVGDRDAEPEFPATDKGAEAPEERPS